MPIENERKFVLNDAAGELERRVAATGNVTVALLRQAYLESPGVRIREIARPDEVERVFTFKRSVEGKVVEIETALSGEDFDLLWQIRKETLVKVRYHLVDGPFSWDIDFFKAGDAAEATTYFAMAEVEMAPDRAEAPPVPAFLAADVVHVVTWGDERFTSKRISDQAHAKRLLRAILDGAELPPPEAQAKP